MRLRERYKRLTLWNRLSAWGAVASIAGVLCVLGPCALPSKWWSSGCTSEDLLRTEEFLDHAWVLLGREEGLPRLYSFSDRRSVQLARDQIEKALIVCPESPRAQRYQALYYIAVNRREKAEEILRRLVRRFPRDPAIRNELAGLLRLMDRFAEAASEAEQGLVLAPDDPSLHVNLALTRRAQGRFSDAEASFERALSLDAGDAKAHLYLADVLLKLGRPDEMQRELEAALNLDPSLQGLLQPEFREAP
ncbi:MAG: tetratricopeptide repeat protein [Thermoanaerobaculia bacterium]|nr:tetratricopeptide repeat protein [Thermoanaerobaculia bacterium]